MVLYSLIRIFAAIKDTLVTKKHLIQLFEDKNVRTVWDEEQQKWYFSIVDVCHVLTESKDYQTARKYWNKLKQRLKEEGNESVTNCNQLKMESPKDGKMRLTTMNELKVSWLGMMKRLLLIMMLWGVGAVSIQAQQKEISHIETTKNWYYVYDESGKKIKTLYRNGYGDIKGWGKDFFVTKRGAYYLICDAEGKMLKTLGAQSVGEVISVSSSTFTSQLGVWIFTWIRQESESIQEAHKSDMVNKNAKEKPAFLLHFSRFFVTLEEIAGFLCIKAVPRIEKKIGLRTGDRSVFSNIKVVGNDEVITGKKT